MVDFDCKHFHPAKEGYVRYIGWCSSDPIMKLYSRQICENCIQKECVRYD